MFTLLIDTSQKESYVALYQDSSLFKKFFIKDKEQSKHLLPGIESLLSSNDLTLGDIALIGVSIGPGSFTGTRIGVITAKTLSFAKNIPLIGFKSDENSPIEFVLRSYQDNKLDSLETLSPLYN